MREIIIFDLETNGIRNCSVLSISAIKLEIDEKDLSVKEIGKFDRYYYRNPGEKIEIIQNILMKIMILKIFVVELHIL